MTSGYVSAEPLRLPFEGGSDLPAHCSHAGAKAAAERAGRQALALLAAYREHGPLTDAEAAFCHNIDRLRRLIDRKLGLYVTYDDAAKWREVADVVGYVQRRVAA